MGNNNTTPVTSNSNNSGFALDITKSTATCSGSAHHAITPREQNAFGLDSDTVKNGVKKTMGKRPDDIYLTSPTPWNDLFKTYKWTQVTTNVSPKVDLKTFHTTPEKVVVAHQVFRNK